MQVAEVEAVEAEGLLYPPDPASHELSCIGGNIADVVPGSDEAARLKTVLQENGLWSQYLEVGIGPEHMVIYKRHASNSVLRIPDPVLDFPNQVIPYL